MSTSIEKRVEDLEQKVADLSQLLEIVQVPVRQKDWRRTVGLSANDLGVDKMIRLGRADRPAQQAEDALDADPGH